MEENSTNDIPSHEKNAEDTTEISSSQARGEFVTMTSGQDFLPYSQDSLGTPFGTQDTDFTQTSVSLDPLAGPFCI